MVFLKRLTPIKIGLVVGGVGLIGVAVWQIGIPSYKTYRLYSFEKELIPILDKRREK